MSTVLPPNVAALNGVRCARWHPPESDDWTLGDWGMATGGELGELQNVVKKIRRHQAGAATQYNTPEIDALRDKFAEELADVRLYLDLWINKVNDVIGGLTDEFLNEALVEKFNAVSRFQGWDDLLAEYPNQAPETKIVYFETPQGDPEIQHISVLPSQEPGDHI